MLPTQRSSGDDFEVSWRYATYNGSKFDFLYPPSSNLFCQRCHCLAYEPHLSLCCDSLFCKKCLNFDSCPVCFKAAPDTTNIATFDRRSDKLIQNLKVHCPNSIAGGLGCEWLGKLRDVPDHRKECPREKIPCSYSEVGCKEKMYRNKLEEHEIKSRKTHLHLAMKQVVSLSTTVKELQERMKQLEVLQESVIQQLLKPSFQEFKERSD